VPKARDIKNASRQLGEEHYGVEALLDDIYDPIAEIEIQ